MPLGQGGISAFPGGAQGEIVTWPGIYYGAVSNNADPQKKNRCLLRIPQILGGATTTWASPLTPLVDPPKVGTLVCAMFVGGDLDYPVYLVVNPAVPIETNTANVQPVGTTGSAGASHKVAAADHVHTLANALESTTANISKLGTAAAAGSSPKAARGDHAHDPSGVQTLGTSGFNEVSSSLVTGGDTAATIDLLSRLAVGATEVDINATNVNVGNNAAGTVNIDGSTINFTGTTPQLTGFNFLGLTPRMATPPHYPLGTDPNTGSSWASGERGYINNIVACVNAIVASLQNRGLMN